MDSPSTPAVAGRSYLTLVMAVAAAIMGVAAVPGAAGRVCLSPQQEESSPVAVVAGGCGVGEGEGRMGGPTAWPHQFHSLLVQQYNGTLTTIDLWYEWPKGRNFNIMRHQLGDALVYDLEWNNGTSFLYTLGDPRHCRTYDLEVGILRPDWLDGAEYLGQRSVDGFLCNVWEKANFIWYYEDVLTRRPVHWRFYTGRAIHVMSFEVGAVLEDAEWQAPVYCFTNTTATATQHSESQSEPQSSTRLIRAVVDGSPGGTA